MPILSNSSLPQRGLTISPYTYSGTGIGDLGASEYTLVSMTVDVSGSVGSFRREMAECLAEIVRACLKAPRSDNLMVRAVAFDDSLDELHGFKPLTAVQPDDYNDALTAGGTTALYDASVHTIEAMCDYGRDLTDHGFAANGVLFVLTDGCDNASTLTAQQVKDALDSAISSEALESMVSILVGVNVKDRTVGSQLMKFSSEAGFSHYVELDKADAKTFAKLADFVQRTVIAQSRALGTGAASRLLSF